MKSLAASPDATKSISKKIREFRLLVTRVILGNLRYTIDPGIDIDADHAIAELCEQYCLSIFLHWIAYRNNFPAYSPPIDPDSESFSQPLATWPSIARRYPLYAYTIAPGMNALCQQCFQFLDQNMPLRLDVIGNIYQQQLAQPLRFDADGVPYIDAKEETRSNGQYYTPAWVVSYCLEKAECDRDALESCFDSEAAGPRSFKRIIDPACGSGNFLTGILLRHQVQIQSQTKSRTQLGTMNVNEQVELVTEKLHGRDIDGRAVELCKLSLLIGLSNYLCRIESSLALESEIERILAALDRNVVVTDSVIDSNDLAGFDLVIGNPPYLSYGARNQPAISASWQTFLKAEFPQASEYKVRLHSVFQDICLRLVKPGGHVVLLLPDAFLTGSYYGKIRTLILEKSHVLSLSELPTDTIPGAVVGNWCVAHYRRKQMPDDRTQPSENAGSVSLSKLEGDPKSCPSNTFDLPAAVFVSKDRARFQMVFSDEDAAILEALTDLPRLDEVLTGRTGIRARGGQKSIISQACFHPNHKPGLISGSQVTPFSVRWEGHFLEITPDKLFAGGFDSAVITNPKILIRQTGDRIIAAVDTGHYYHLNNIHSFAPREGSQVNSKDLPWLTALLNSTLYLHLWRIKSREGKRALAQIDIEMVESMPWRLPGEDEREQLSELASRCGSSQSCSSESGSTSLNVDALFAIDRFVYKLFAISPELAQYIDRSHGIHA